MSGNECISNSSATASKPASMQADTHRQACKCGARCNLCGRKWNEEAVDVKSVTVYGYCGNVSNEDAKFSLQSAAYRCSDSSCKGIIRWDGDNERILVHGQTGMHHHFNEHICEQFERSVNVSSKKC
jgi:hypothetical protein